MKPILIDLSQTSIKEFSNLHPVESVIDFYDELLKELFLIRNPRYKFEKDISNDLKIFIDEHNKGRTNVEVGKWFYFPWNKIIAHYLDEPLHLELRTARNKFLITKEEQEKIYNLSIGIIGLSVGSHSAQTLAMMGIGNKFKLADFDSISGTNLNRIKYDFLDLNKNKCDLVTHYIYQVNPYAEIIQYRNGVSIENLDEFLTSDFTLDFLIEEADNLGIKIAARIAAKKFGIPVIMATDNGDNVIIDIERYDVEKNLQIFNGLLGDFNLENFKNIAPQDIPKLATKIAGESMIVPRMLNSLLEVGRSLYSWPQLGNAATMSGGVIAYLVKRIALQEKCKSGKIEVNLDSIFDPDYFDKSSMDLRKNKFNEFANKIGL